MGTIDRFLESSLGSSSKADPEAAPKPGGRTPQPPKRPNRLGRGVTWKRATAAEGIGVLVILLFVLIARPDPNEAALDTGEPDLFEAVATGVTSDGVVTLASGAEVHLLGVQLPTADDPTAVRAAAIRGLDRIMRGRRVRVEFDPVLPSRMQEGLPQMTAYVWLLNDEGQRRGMANAMLISRGLARPVTRLGYRHQAQFLEAARLAQSRAEGVWQPQPQALPQGLPVAF